jgi:Holliday junction resolvase
MSASQRRKGAVGERELFRLLSDELGFVVRRNVDQARNGGADCIELPGFAVECKRQERLCLPAWWRQAVRQGIAMQAEPIVWYRRSREPWRALLRTADGGYRVAEWAEAVMYVREKLQRLHAIYPEKEAA